MPLEKQGKRNAYSVNSRTPIVQQSIISQNREVAALRRRTNRFVMNTRIVRK